MNKMPTPRPFADVARDVAAARASLPAPDDWLKEAERLVDRYGHAVALGSAALNEERELLAHLRARHGADTDRPRSDEKESGVSPMTAMDSKPVAMRYRTGEGRRWRYLNLPHTKGWTFPPNLGVPEYLYAAAPSDTALLKESMEALENCESEMRDLWSDHPSRKMNAATLAKLRERLKDAT